jgi:hypothetical protein
VQSARDDLPERLSLITLVAPRVSASRALYRERAEHLRRIAETETDPTLRGNLLMLAERYDELGGVVA